MQKIGPLPPMDSCIANRVRYGTRTKCGLDVPAVTIDCYIHRWATEARFPVPHAINFYTFHRLIPWLAVGPLFSFPQRGYILLDYVDIPWCWGRFWLGFLHCSWTRSLVGHSFPQSFGSIRA